MYPGETNLMKIATVRAAMTVTLLPLPAVQGPFTLAGQLLCGVLAYLLSLLVLDVRSLRSRAADCCGKTAERSSGAVAADLRPNVFHAVFIGRRAAR
jgi:hypothetical protein